MTFLLNEDRALRNKLKGLTVVDANSPPGGRPVGVRYRLPETELGDQTFPLIVINRKDLLPATDREHRGRVSLMYTPEGIDTWNTDVEQYSTSPYTIDYPIPMDITYQITVMARFELHIVSIAAQLAQADRLPFRFGYLAVPEDGTVRSLFVDGGPEFEPGRDGDSKRLFQAHYMIRIPTELVPADLSQATAVSTVSLDLETTH